MSAKTIAHSFLIFAILLNCRPSSPERLSSEQIQRLADICKVWNAVKYTHPHLGRQSIDWDRALVEVIPSVMNGGADANFRADVESMLSALNDPATQVESASSGRTISRILNPRPGALLIGRHRLAELNDHQAFETAVRKAELILVDLRAATIEDGQKLAGRVESLAPYFVGREILPQEQLFVLHWGYRPRRGSTSGGFSSRFATKYDELMIPRAPSATRRLVFLINEQSTLPPFAAALQHSQGAIVIADGKISDAPFTKRRLISLRGLRVWIRASELVPDRFGTFAPDIVLPPDYAEEQMWESAFGSEPRPQTEMSARKGPLQYAPLPDDAYPSMKAPTVEYRILALFRAWGVIDSFYPYKHLIKDWDATLADSIPKFIAAERAADYARTIMQFMSSVEDGHTNVHCLECSKLIGMAGAPFAIRSVEGRAVITDLPPAVASTTGLRKGDIVVEIDGQPVARRVDAIAALMTASAPHHLRFRLLNASVRGPAELPLALRVERKPGEYHDVTVSRRIPLAKPAGDPSRDFRLLGHGVGYVDLTKLEVREVDEMFEFLRHTRAIIFDMRGYPRRTAWEIAPRLNVRGVAHGARFRRPLVGGDSTDMWQSFQEFSQALPSSTKWKYEGETLMLVDERTISQAEHTGLFFEAANGTVFIGSATAVANGDVTNFCLPGDVWVTFSGHGVAHADGRQLQRVGLRPSLEVEPTIAGIRQGRDEVLEAALKFVTARSETKSE